MSPSETARMLISDAQNTWCPGCGNFSIQFTLKAVLEELDRGEPIRPRLRIRKGRETARQRR